MDIVVAVGEDLVFVLEGLPAATADAVRAFCGHYLRPGPAAAAIPIRAGAAPPGRAGDPDPVLSEPPLVVRRAAGCVLFELPGLLAWCDSAAGEGGVVVEAPEPSIVEIFATRSLPLLLFELSLSHGWIGLHAAAIACQGRAILLPGPSGSGKTTLFRGAAEAGLGVLSDDMVWLRETDEGFRVVAFPRGSAAAPVPQPTEDDVPLGAIVCPTIEARGSSRLISISPAEVVRELVAQCTFLGHEPHDGERFCRLVRIAREAPGYRLEAGPESDAVDLLRDRFGSEDR